MGSTILISYGLMRLKPNLLGAFLAHLLQRDGQNWLTTISIIFVQAEAKYLMTSSITLERILPQLVLKPKFVIVLSPSLIPLFTSHYLWKNWGQFTYTTTDRKKIFR